MIELVAKIFFSLSLSFNLSIFVLGNCAFIRFEFSKYYYIYETDIFSRMVWIVDNAIMYFFGLLSFCLSFQMEFNWISSHLYNLNQSVYSFQHWNLYFICAFQNKLPNFFIVSFSVQSIFPYRNLKSKNVLLYLLHTMCVRVCISCSNANLLSEVRLKSIVSNLCQKLCKQEEIWNSIENWNIVTHTYSVCLCVHNVQLLFYSTSFTFSR